MTRRPLRISLALALALTACHPKLMGSGVLGEEVRIVAPFDAVDVSLAIEATVSANAAAQRVIISGDANLLQYVATPVEAEVLRTRLHGTAGIEPVLPLRIAAQATALRAVRATEAAHVDVSGAGDVNPSFVFEVEASGASHVQLRGSGGHHLVVNLSGGSGLDASAYAVDGATLLLGGGSTLRVHSTGDPIGTVSGGSSVQVSGGGSCAALALSGGSTCTSP
jgi:hypothetical protein